MHHTYLDDVLVTGASEKEPHVYIGDPKPTYGGGSASEEGQVQLRRRYSGAVRSSD